VHKALALLALLGVALLAGGCGKDKPDPTTAWANDFCSSITTWEDSVTATANSITAGNLSKEGLTTAANDAKSATTKLLDDLKNLGKPPTDTGDQAKQHVDQLSSQIQDGVQTVTSSVQDASGVSGILNAISVASATLATMTDQVTTTFNELKQLDGNGSGELQNAFKQADSCKDLTTTTTSQ
jgi:outer membrane murein-binding lipoprotein Lpp